MTELERYREQIEDTLGRALTDEDLVAVPDLAQLSPAQVATARELASRQIVLCGLYLRAVTPASVGAAKQYMDALLR